MKKKQNVLIWPNQRQIKLSNAHSYGKDKFNFDFNKIWLSEAKVREIAKQNQF